MSKPYAVELDAEEAAFMHAIYNALGIGSLLEHPLSKFADKLLDSGGPVAEYELVFNGQPVPTFGLGWRKAGEKKQR